MRILIVGGGTSGWMTAAALAKLLPVKRYAITLVESEQIGTVGVGEATVPHIRYFNENLGFDEADLMAQTKATFKLGIEFRNWGKIGDAYIHPFGAFGNDLANVSFHHHWVRAAKSGPVASLQDFSLPVLAARQNKFIFPDADESSPLSTFSYAYQFDATLYAAFLRAFAETRGVNRIEGKITDVERNNESGFVESVRLEDDRQIDADLFVDCSGFRGLLIQDAMEVEFDDWSHWLPCDSAYAVPCDTVGPMTPYTRSTAQDAGWTWRIPLQHRVGNGHVFSSAHTDNESALSTLLGQLESPPLLDPKLLRFRAGKRRKQWSGNVVAIGLASGFLEPLESTSIHLIQLAIGYLVDMLPDRNFDPMNETEFNRVMTLEYERIRDFLILHYHATQRDDSSFWNHCRTMPIPDSLDYRMQLFRERGLVPHYREGMFLDASWLAVYFGQNIIPDSHDPRAAQIPQEQLASILSSVGSKYQSAVNGMPIHEDFLRRSGAWHETGTRQ